MRVDGNHGGRLHYEPNSYGEWREQPDFSEPPLALDGAVDRYDYREDDSDYFTQPGNLFRLMSAEEQQRLFDNTARSMQGVERHIQLRHIRHCLLADPAYGGGVARALGIAPSAIGL
jgi:catalase